MSKEKQIEEMAKIICASHNNGACVFNHEPCDLKCSAHGEAKKLYDSGYRKASEVAREIFQMLRDDLRGEVDMEYLERLIAIYEKKYTESENHNENK